MLKKRRWQQNSQRHNQYIDTPNSKVNYFTTIHNTTCATNSFGHSLYRTVQTPKYRHVNIGPVSLFTQNSIIIGFHYEHRRMKSFAHILTISGRQFLIPAIRGMYTGQYLNATSYNIIGTFQWVHTLPNGTHISNLVFPPYRRIWCLRAPGTRATIRTRHPKFGTHIQLPRRRSLFTHQAVLAQVGINMHHDKRHTNIGSAGQARYLGRAPHVRMGAKNPCNRISPRRQFKAKQLHKIWK